MVRSRVVRVAIALIALGVPAGAAAAGSTEPDDGAPENASEGSEPSASDDPAAADGDDDTGDAPIDPEFQIDMMLGLVPESEMTEYWNQQSQEQELRVQACMNDAGFDYEPMDQGAMTFDQYNGLSQMEWAQQYGFGMWTQMDPDNSPYGNQMVEWPNDDIVSELSPSEQNAWYSVNERCNQEAYTGNDDPWMNPMVQEIMEDFNTRVENDGRVRDALAAWRDCMAESGHPFASQEDMWEAVWGQGDDQEMWDLQAQFYESEAWLESSPDHAEWQALVDEEIEIAVADATCTPVLEDVRTSVRRDLRPGLVEVWQTIDWSLPPVTYDDLVVTDGTMVVEGEPPAATDDTGDAVGTEAESGSTEAPVALDLGDPVATTEP
jgi:hypothetical protein